MFAVARTSDVVKRADSFKTAPRRRESSAVHQTQQAAGNRGTPRLLQAKLAISRPGDVYEQEAERVSEQVMRTAAPPIQRLCTDGDEELHRSADRTGDADAPDVRLDSLVAGQPLTHGQKAFFEPRFGHDFSKVRIHTDAAADAAARGVGALAFTHGRDIAFRSDQYRPDTPMGQRLLAHELTHVVQQGAADWRGPAVQRAPGDGMTAPGDCSWAKYLTLRLAVETAKAVVAVVGRGCRQGEPCLDLAIKIAALSAEMVARFTLAATCFRGGDQDHIDVIEEKANALVRCYRIFSNSRCSPDLITNMAVVVDLVRQAIATVTVAAMLVVVAALIVAIIALVEAIVAAIAAAVAAAAAAIASAPIASAAAALTALLGLLLREIAPAGRPPTST